MPTDSHTLRRRTGEIDVSRPPSEPVAGATGDGDAAPGVPDDITPFQRRMWRAQRIAWWCMLGIVVAALLGVLGDGPMSRGTRSSASGATTVEWHRVVRAQSPFDIELRGHALHRDRVVVAVSPSLARHFDTVRLVPDAESERAVGDGMQWEVAVAPGRPVRVRIDTDVRRIGILRGTIRLGDDDAVAVSLLVLP